MYLRLQRTSKSRREQRLKGSGLLFPLVALKRKNVKSGTCEHFSRNKSVLSNILFFEILQAFSGKTQENEKLPVSAWEFFFGFGNELREKPKGKKTVSIFWGQAMVKTVRKGCGKIETEAEMRFSWDDDV